MRLSVTEYNALLKQRGNVAHGRSGRGRRPAAPKKYEEDALQMSCIHWTSLNTKRYPLLEWMFHTPNGGRRNVLEAKRFKKMGVKPGVADLIIPFPSPGRTFPGLWLEMKSATGALSREQLRWKVKAEKEGWLTAVVRDLDHYIEVVDAFMAA